ncbi:MAG: flagellar hook-associated protein FlgL [Oceanidesulfovibrio sp.]
MAYMRVSQQNVYTNFLNNMNRSLTDLMNLNVQASSQKRINAPSDDPAGAARVRNYRAELSRLEQYRENVSTARGWLGQADSTLMQANTVLTRCKELAEQAATGTMSKSNREQVGFELRELFEQLINLSNSEFEGKHIFSGHKTNNSAFEAGLAVTTNDSTLSGTTFSITGASDKTTVVQFLEDGSTGNQVGNDEIRYRYSTDAGESWTEKTLAVGARELDLGGVRVTMENNASVEWVEPDITDTSVDNGSWLWVRPTAVYKGDDKDAVEVDQYGNDLISATADGVFDEDVYVRIDSATDLGSEIEYSYSLDGGLTWKTGNTVSNAATSSSAVLVLPGGTLDLASNGGNALSAGSQFILRPRRADINFEISPGEKMAVNSVGKDVFGGIYHEPYASNATAALGGDARNVFETVGRLVGYVESNNQAGVQQALADLTTASEHLLTQAARVGGKENRLDVAKSVLSSLELNREEQLSNVEDVDVSELLTKLAQQQIIYESVLKSSSQVLRMSLVNYI